ncbi:MAG: 6-carboxytetrahydropterin synthase QueD [candidate division WOR-3 bacterium]
MNFSAAHFLKNYRNKCERVHGHNYKVVVYINGDKLNKNGILYDFKEIKEYLKKIIPDHQHLNELFLFNPTAENLAYHFYYVLKKKYPIKKIEVWEDDTQGAVYEESSD